MRIQIGKLIQIACIASLFSVMSVVMAQGIPPELHIEGGLEGQVRIATWRGSTMAPQELWVRKNSEDWIPLGLLYDHEQEFYTELMVENGDTIDVKMWVDCVGQRTIYYSSGRYTQDGEPGPRIISHWQDGENYYCGYGSDNEVPFDITELKNTGNDDLSISCWEDVDDWDYNDFALRVDFVPDDLGCPENLAAECSDTGGEVELSWAPVLGAVDYVVRMDREPYDDWYNENGGDQFFYTGGATSATRIVESGASYTWSVQPVRFEEEYPHDSCTSDGPEFTCDCASMQINAIDPDGAPVDVAEVFIAERNDLSHWGLTIENCYDCSSCLVESGLTSGIYGVGGFVNKYPNQIILGATPDPSEGINAPFLSHDDGYFWGDDHMNGGHFQIDVVVATKTPMPTPTPQIEVNAIDTDGNPVDTAELGVSKVDFLAGLPFFTDATEFCSDCSSVVENNVSLGTFGAGGYVTPYPDQVVLGVTPVPDNGDQIRDEGYAWQPDGGAGSGLSGDHAIDYVLATMTPVPGTIIAHTFLDDNGNGVWDADEDPLPSIRVDVSSGAHGSTDAAGDIVFSEPPGSYTVAVDTEDVDIPSGAVLTTEQSQGVSVTAGGTEHVYFGFDTTLPCPTGLAATCSELGGQVTLSWDSVDGAADYLVRMNREPYDDWPNADEGDQEFFTGGATSVTRDIDSGYDYQWSIQPAKSGESPPLSGCEEDGPVFNCSCPSIQVYAIDPDGNPVNVEEVGIAEMDLDEFVGYWGARLDRCYGCSSLIVDSGVTAGELGVGGYADPNPDQVVLGVTPDPDTGHRRSNGYYWNADGDMGSTNAVEVVLATMTPVPGTITAHAFRDDDGDGVQDAGEPGLPGYRVDVSSGAYGSTDSSGVVTFSESPGSYTVEIENPDGHTMTTPQTQDVDLSPGETEHVYFGFQIPGTLRVHVFRDYDGDGLLDGDEPGLGSVRVDISDGQYGLTDGSGIYTYSPAPGTYTVEVDDSDDDIPAGSVPTTSVSQIVDLAANGTEDVYFGFQPPGSILAHVWLDEDGDGVWDTGEVPIVNVRVDLSSGPYGSSDIAGVVEFTEPPGSYTVEVAEDDSDLPTGAVPTTPTSQGVDLASEETEHVYFGFRVPSAMIVAHTFFDDDGDGVWDDGEDPLPAIRIDLNTGDYGSTNATGEVSFELAPNTYSVDVDETDNDIPVDAVLTTLASQVVTVGPGETEHVYFGFRVPGTIIAHTFLDDNENGVWDAGEEPLPAIRIDLNNGDYGSTNAAGEVSFDEYPGYYVVDVDEMDNDIPTGAVLTTPGSHGVDLGPQGVERVYFGFHLSPVTIIAHTYYDNDGDGVWDGDEPPMPSIRVDVSSGAYGSTDGDGDVIFEEEPGSYTVEVDDDDGDIPQDATLTNPRSQDVAPDPGETVHVYFGFHVPSRIIAYTFYDDDGNGVWDTGEDDMPYIRVDLSNGDYGSTNWDGEEIFDVDPGDYTVIVDEDDGSIPADAVLTTPGSQSVTVGPGEVEEVYFGFRVPGTIIAHTFLDDNGNGSWDSGEDALPSIRIDISSGAYGSTGSDGRRDFQEWPGDYTVEVDDTDSDIPPEAVLTMPRSQSVGLGAGDVEHVYFGFQRLCEIEGGVYFDEDNNGVYDAGTDTGLPDIRVDINCLYGYGGTVNTDSSGRYSLADMPVGTCTIQVDENDSDLPADAELVAGDNPATVLCAGEQYLFGVSETWEGTTPSGHVFVHVYVHGLAIPEGDYRSDDLIHLDIQRWSGLAPIFRPDYMPELCLQGTATCTVASNVMTERFVVEDIDGDGQAVENLTGKQPTFDYPNGQEVVYDRLHHWGDTNYDYEEYLWILLLSKGGLTPDDGLAAPPGTWALAETGYPGTYQIEGTLYLSVEWTGLFNYEHHWDIPIEFYITQRAPYPQVSPRYLP